MAQAVRIVGHKKDNDDFEQLQAQVRPNGSLCVSDEGWNISDKDESVAGTMYVGFVDKDGRWYIMKAVTVASVTTYRYTAGNDTYALNWTNRASLSTFDYYYNTF